MIRQYLTGTTLLAGTDLPLIQNYPPPLPFSQSLPEQTGERVRGGGVAAAVAASSGPRRSAAGPSGLSLPG